MNILFVHQSFPGQFKHLAPALVARGHQVVALTVPRADTREWMGVKLAYYEPARNSAPEIHPWVSDMEAKVIRGDACMRAAVRLQEQGFVPDVIIAHPGWGESLFLKDVWPQARLGIYCEYYYRTLGGDSGYDPEFSPRTVERACRLRLKNFANIMQFEVADAGISPTHWQAGTFPEPFRSRITVAHDGIDTDTVAPNPSAALTLNGHLKLTRRDELITFVNRNLEPLRGYHIFMRALPELLRRRPRARILIVGGNEVSYSPPPANGQSWKDIFAAEVRPRISDADWGRVHFLGVLPYPYFVTLLQLSTVHVYLTYPFVLGWSLLEAMSAECAIVASNTPSVAEAITSGETGRLVEFFDGSQLTETVCALLKDPAERKRLGKNARKLARANYDLKRVCLPGQLAWAESLAP